VLDSADRGSVTTDVRPSPPLAPGPLPGEQRPEQSRLGRAVEHAIFGAAAVYLLLVLGAIVLYKAALVESFSQNVWFVVYGVTVTAYILSRFVVALAYRPAPDVGLQPSVAIVMPAFNEEDALARSVGAMLDLDYDPDRLQVVIINDGSTDGTARVLAALEAEHGDRVQVIHFARNRGKREAMAAGIRATTAEIVAFVDSDSVLEPDAMRAIVQPFADEGVGAVCGHADVLQPWASWLTRMQAVRYYVAFRVIKAAESVFSVVTCCSGCFAVYRRRAVLPVLEPWRAQRFLGVQCTYGDDRSLTNRVLRDWRVVYQSTARSHTIVPERTPQFMRQQLRWKRSWTRESVASARFMWRKHPAGALPIYIGIVLPLLAPFTVVYALYWAPLHLDTGLPWIYLCGIYAMALVYGLYYEIKDGRGNGLWIWGAIFVFFYLAYLWIAGTDRSAKAKCKASGSSGGTAP
jgi:hyaluronan synthase